MKNKIYIFILLFSIFQIGNAQEDFYYTFNNDKNIIYDNPDKKVLFFENGYTTNTSVPTELPGLMVDERTFIIPSDRDLSPYSNYRVFPSYITRDDRFEMFYNNEIVLKFKPDDDSGQIDNLIRTFNLNFVESTSSYNLYTTNDDALQVSKLLYETGYLEFCTPNFISKAEHFDHISNDQNFNQDGDLLYTGQEINNSKNTKVAYFSHIPNDQYFNQQWYLHNTGQGTNDGKSTAVNADIDAPEAWDITKGDPNVIVAVID
ncbi:MAG TPA: hypothetical protein VF677_05670 [Flavobacterium sp.]